jgi:peptidoglycan hydrolase-like protein with peptidoglycan-binding domain
MNHATRVALALVLGAGLATAAQAQDTYSQGAAPKGQSAAPAMNNMQDAAPTARMKRATPGRGHKASGQTQKMNRQQVKMAQQKLKSEGFYRGRIDGVMGPQTRLAMTRFQQESGSSSMGRQTTSRGQPSQAGLGAGSSMPNNNPKAMNSPDTAMTPPTNQATTGAGGSTAPSNTGGTTTPSNPAAKY